MLNPILGEMSEDLDEFLHYLWSCSECPLLDSVLENVHRHIYPSHCENQLGHQWISVGGGRKKYCSVSAKWGATSNQ